MDFDQQTIRDLLIVYGILCSLYATMKMINFVLEKISAGINRTLNGISRLFTRRTKDQ